MTGHGGWPMTVFLTPDGEPFYARHLLPAGRPARHAVVPARARVASPTRGASRRDGVDADRRRRCARCTREPMRAARRAGALDRRHARARASAALAAQLRPRSTAASAARRSSRRRWRSTSCCAHWARTGDERALDDGRAARSARMARGGIYDQVGGGFHRYSVDARWLVPHFEKMLYDNALLARLGVHLWQATRRRRGAPRDRGDARLARARDDVAGRRLLLRRSTPTARGTRGSSTSGTPTSSTPLLGDDDEPPSRRYWGVTAGGQLRGAQHPASCALDPAPARREDGSDPALADAVRRAKATLLRGARAARPAGARRQGPRRVERADAARGGRGGARVRRRRAAARWRVRNGEFLARARW